MAETRYSSVSSRLLNLSQTIEAADSCTHSLCKAFWSRSQFVLRAVSDLLKRHYLLRRQHDMWVYTKILQLVSTTFTHYAFYRHSQMQSTVPHKWPSFDKSKKAAWKFLTYSIFQVVRGFGKLEGSFRWASFYRWAGSSQTDCVNLTWLYLPSREIWSSTTMLRPANETNQCDNNLSN